MTAKQARERAHRGAEFLDKKLGRGWRRRVLRRRLDMSIGGFHRRDPHSCGCVLAQLSGNYTDGSEQIGIEPFGRKAVSLGFRYEQLDGGYDLLTAAWREELRA